MSFKHLGKGIELEKLKKVKRSRIDPQTDQNTDQWTDQQVELRSERLKIIVYNLAKTYTDTKAIYYLVHQALTKNIIPKVLVGDRMFLPYI